MKAQTFDPTFFIYIYNLLSPRTNVQQNLKLFRYESRPRHRILAAVSVQEITGNIFLLSKQSTYVGKENSLRPFDENLSVANVSSICDVLSAIKVSTNCRTDRSIDTTRN